jgi:CheY-like chemotaxis protein
MQENLNKYIRESHRHLLVVEDSDTDFVVLNRVLKNLSFNYPIHRCCDGDEALDYLYHIGKYKDIYRYPQPDLILLDLNLPGTDGKDILDEIKQNPQLKSIPIVIFTTSSNPQDIKTCYQRGANNYLLKPMDFGEMKITVESLINYWFNISLLPTI